ncbi:ABC transporter substrate-binding protein [Leucobacter chromiireducens]|uniref:ABC transporter substrate-binding protein n=1 Tax=Leucobacter chromiireducens subsp. chromiireducens TaxID=660067 RepID=A0ABS1SNU4_9MICO|nr:ABC transporter substrate-binding protein [Leucobacter chromiireducens]MBL3689842.1 ABC transporter substrate-binding protein [Leucobacter chromiireducens subsp. chromiireducens]
MTAHTTGRASRWRRRTARTLAGLGAASILLAGLAPAANAEAQKPAIRVALLGDVDTMNPFLSVLWTSLEIMRLQYEPLVEWAAEDNTETPAIAESWEASDDAKEWTFHLEQGAKWSDGEPIVADDVIWTVEAIQGDDALKMANGSLVENIESISAPDAETVVMQLRDPQGANPGTDLPIVPSHVWSKIDDPAGFANDADAVGSGPFIVQSSSKTDGVVMTANPNYRHGIAPSGGVTWIPFKNSDAAVQALKTGELDMIGDLTVAQFEALEGIDGITTVSGAGRGYSSIAINPGATDIDGKPLGDGNPVLHDPVVRSAIIRAIDSKTLLDKVLGGHGAQATGEVPPLYPKFYWDVDPASLPLAFDPAAANKMLDDAGYEMGPNGLRLDKNGAPISLRLMGNSASSTHQQVADFVKPWLTDIGIEIKTTMLSAAQVNDESVLGRYDLYFTGWSMGPDPDFLMALNQCSSRPNADGSGATSESNWCSPEFDAMYAQMHSELDADKRAELMVGLQKLIYESASNNVLYYGDAFQAYRSDRFTDVQKQPAEGGVILAQNGPWGLYSATPLAAAPAGDGGSGAGATWWIVGGAAAVLLLGGVLFARRRATAADDRE